MANCSVSGRIRSRRGLELKILQARPTPSPAPPSTGLWAFRSLLSCGPAPEASLWGSKYPSTPQPLGRLPRAASTPQLIDSRSGHFANIRHHETHSEDSISIDIALSFRAQAPLHSRAQSRNAPTPPPATHIRHFRSTTTPALEAVSTEEE